MIRKIRDCIIFFSLSLSLALVGSEALLRVLNQAKPGQAANIIKPEDIVLSFNAEGFRDRDYDKTKASGVFRILVLGNSATFGVSVTIQQTYVKQLEEMLNEQKSAMTFEVINAGVPSWNTLYQQAYLESMGLEYDPDLVLIGYTLDSVECHYVPPEDLFSSETKYQDNPEVLHRSPQEWARPILDHRNQDIQTSQLLWMWQNTKLWLSNYSSLYRYIQWRYDLSKQPFNTQNYPNALYYQEASEHWDLCRNALLNIEQTLRIRQTPVILVVFPFFVRLKPGPNPDEGYLWDDIHDLITSASREIGMQVIDMLPVFRGWDPRDISVDTYHMNPLGHRMAAEAIYAALVENHLIPQTTSVSQTP